MRGRVAFGALPWLMHDRPFVQGLTASAEIGSAMARAVSQQAAGDGAVSGISNSGALKRNIRILGG